MSNSPESYPEQKFKKHTIIRNKHEQDEKMVVMDSTMENINYAHMNRFQTIQMIHL